MRALRRSLAIVVSTAALAAAGAVISAATQVRDVERGRYLSIIGGCNDCHTPGYLEKSGAVPESLMSEAEWLTHARAARRPPMPWFNVRAMSDADLGALYAYLRSLGPGGEPAPAYVPPGEHVATPYIDFVPKNVPAERRAAG